VQAHFYKSPAAIRKAAGFHVCHVFLPVQLAEAGKQLEAEDVKQASRILSEDWVKGLSTATKKVRPWRPVACCYEESGADNP